MTPSEEPPRDLMDRMIRDTLRDPENLRDFLSHALPDLAAGFDYGRARLIDPVFTAEDWRRREADLPFEIPYRTGEGEVTALVCVLIEHQSDTDPVMPLRLLFFAAGYWDRQWQLWSRLSRPRPPLRLSPVVPIVLYTAQIPWGSNRTLLDLMGEPAAFHRFTPVWEPLFWNLADQTAKDLLDSEAEWLQFLAVVRAERAAGPDFERVFTQALRHLIALADRDAVRWQSLLNCIVSYASNRRPRDERTSLLQVPERTYPNRPEVRHMTQTIADSWREEGRAEGALQTSRALLRGLLEERFGTLPEALIQQIEALTDVGRLQTAARRLVHVQKLEDFSL